MQTRASEVGEELNILFNSIPHNYCPAGALKQTQDQKLGHKFKYSAFPKFSQEDYYFGLGIRMRIKQDNSQVAEKYDCI